MTFWDKIAGVYDLAESINGDVYHEMCAQTERLVPVGAKVLDCAAGTGELSLAAAKKADSVVCTDLSEKMLKNARRKAGFFGADNISFEKSAGRGQGAFPGAEARREAASADIHHQKTRKAADKALQGDRLRPRDQLFPRRIQENAGGMRAWQGLHEADKGYYPVLLCSYHQERSRGKL